ncbi:MAG TPA: hypothetical protein VM187_09835, partial [Niastella sp.]|nr:hypothetical protein [Niastella sp.]
PDIENIATALASTNFAGLNQDTGIATIDFTIDGPKKVSAGFVVNFTGNEQNVRASSVKLEKIN